MLFFKKQALAISLEDACEFVGKGLRSFFEYRDLGIREGTKHKLATQDEEAPK